MEQNQQITNIENRNFTCEDFKSHPDLYKKIADFIVELANDNPALKAEIFGKIEYYREEDLREYVTELSLEHFVLDGQLCMGLYPRYQYNPVYMYRFNSKDKGMSNLSRGIAFGPYGSGIRERTIYLKDIKRKCLTKTIFDKYYDRAVALYNEIITTGVKDHN